MGRTGRGLSLSFVYSLPPYSFLRAPLDYWKEYSPGMPPPTPPVMEATLDGPELTLTFFSRTFLGPLGLECSRLLLILSPALSQCRDLPLLLPSPHL